MLTFQVTIDEWDGDGALRIPDEVLQALDLYIIEAEPVTQTLVLSKIPNGTSSSMTW